MSTPPGTRLVIVAEDADRLFFGRSESGDLLTFEWGEPDELGRYTPIITAHHHDNLLAELVQAAKDYLGSDGLSGNYDARSMIKARDRVRTAIAKVQQP